MNGFGVMKLFGGEFRVGGGRLLENWEPDRHIQDSRELVCEQLFEGAMEIMREFLETSSIHGIAHISTEKVKVICCNLISLFFCQSKYAGDQEEICMGEAASMLMISRRRG